MKSGVMRSARKTVQDQVFKAGAESGRLQEGYERLEGSEEAALQAQKAEDALAKARPAIAQYLRLRIAAEVLQRHGFVPREATGTRPDTGPRAIFPIDSGRTRRPCDYLRRRR